MLKVSKLKSGGFKVRMGQAEWQLLVYIANGYGISPTAALGSCINKGLDEHSATLKQANEHDRPAEDRDTLFEGNAD